MNCKKGKSEIYNSNFSDSNDEVNPKSQKKYLKYKLKYFQLKNNLVDGCNITLPEFTCLFQSM